MANDPPEGATETSPVVVSTVTSPQGNTSPRSPRSPRTPSSRASPRFPSRSTRKASGSPQKVRSPSKRGSRERPPLVASPKANQEETREPPATNRAGCLNGFSMMRETISQARQESAMTEGLQDDPHDENTEDGQSAAYSDNQHDESNSAWLLRMFQNMQSKHAREKREWEDNVTREAHKKAAYKTKLRSAYKERLKWLEDQLEHAETSGVCWTAPKEIPNLSRASTNTTTGSGGTTSDSSVGRVRDPPPTRRLVSPKKYAEGYEVTFGSSNSVQRVQELEEALQASMQKHEEDRALWVQRLEEATYVGEHLTAQQEAKLRELQSEVMAQEEAIRDKDESTKTTDATREIASKKWKEQVAILKELLQLTEQQLESERKHWEEEIESIQAARKRLSAENQQLSAEATKLNQDLREARSQLDAVQRLQGEWNHERKAYEDSIEKLVEEKSNMEGELDKFRKNSALLSSNSRQPVPLDEGVLDAREMKQMKDRFEVERKQWLSQVDEVLASERKRASEHLDQERQRWAKDLDGKEADRLEVVARLEKERKQWNQRMSTTMKQLETEAKQQMQELRDIHITEMSELQTGDAELAKKLRDVVESRNALLHRVRRIEEQKSEEKCAWKLQLEAALADARQSKGKVKDLEKQLVQMRERQEAEINQFQRKMAAERVQFTHQLSEMNVVKMDRHVEERVQAVLEEQECQLLLQNENSAKELKKQKEEVEKRDVIIERRDQQISRLQAELEAQLQIIEEKTSTLEREQADRTMREEAHSREIKTTLSQFHDSRSEAQMLFERTSDMEKRIAESNEAHVKEIEEWAAKIDDAQAEIRTLQTRSEDLQARLKMALEEKGKVSQDLLVLATQLDDSKVQIRQLQENLKDMETILKANGKEKEKNARQTLEWAKQMKEAKKHNRSLVEKVGKLKKRLDEEAEENHKISREASEWSKQLAEAKNDVDKLRTDFETEQELKEKHEQGEMKWKQQALAAHAESLDLSDRLEIMANRHETLQSHHDQAKRRWDRQIERLKVERSRSVDQSGSESSDRETGQATTIMQKHSEGVLEAIERLHEDLKGVKETVDESNSTDRVDSEQTSQSYDAFRGDMEKMQTGLEEVVTLISTETKALSEARSAFLQKTEESHKVAADAQRGPDPCLLELQTQLFSEVRELRDGIQRMSDDNQITSPKRADVLRKDVALAKCQAKIELLSEQLTTEVAKREKAESEVATLNDQADAYTEELMNLQATKARLEATLTEAEMKMAAALSSKVLPTPANDVFDFDSESEQEDDGMSPLLDEALALAKGISDIVHVRDGEGNEASAMEILENLSELMDSSTLPAQSVCSPNSEGFTPDKSGRLAPKAASKVERKSGRVPTIQIVVDQMYARCQVLERDRIVMMETTLELLEAARRASKPDLEAALQKSHVKSAEEIKQTRCGIATEREKLFHRVCGNVRGPKAVPTGNHSKKSDHVELVS